MTISQNDLHSLDNHRLLVLARSVDPERSKAGEAELIRRLEAGRDLVTAAKAIWTLVYEQLDKMDDEEAEDLMNTLQEKIRAADSRGDQ